MTLEQRLHSICTPTHAADGRPLDADEQDREQREAFTRLALAIERTFQTPDGQRTLSALVKLAHPMASRFDGATDALQAARRDGECSIVALLWTYGAQATKP